MNWLERADRWLARHDAAVFVIIWIVVAGLCLGSMIALFYIHRDLDTANHIGQMLAPSPFVP